MPAVILAPAQATLDFLEQLSRRVQNARVGEVTPEMISPIFFYLNPATIPTSFERSRHASRLQLHLVINTFLVIMTCDEHLRADPALVARFMQPDGWPRIWKWMQFLYDQCVVEKVFGEEVCATTIVSIGAILQALGRSAASRDIVARTPGVLALVTKEWLADDGRYAIAACMQLGGNERAILGALDALLDCHERELEVKLESIVPQVLDAAGGDAKLVASTVLKRLREALAAESMQQVELHLSLADRLADTACPPIHLALLNAGMIPAVITVLSWYNSRPLHAAPAQVMLLCYYILIDSFRTANNPSWAAQAIDAGLIPALLRSGKRVRALNDPELAQPLVWLLSESLPPYLVFRSVLRAVRRALRQVYKRNVGAKGVLGEAWADFQELAEDRLCLLDEWDCEVERDRHRGCSRPLCDNGSGSATKLCSGCLGPMYCSKECQRMDWPAHKSCCKAARQTVQEGGRVQLDPLDHHFIHYIADREIRSRLPGIIKDAHAAGTPLSTLVLELDYSVTPFAFHVSSVSDHRPAAGERAPDDQWQATLDYAEASGGELMATRTVILQGESEGSWTGTVNIQNALALAPTVAILRLTAVPRWATAPTQTRARSYRC